MPTGKQLGGIRGESGPTRLREISTADWWIVAKRVYQGFWDHNLTLVAAGVAFYGMLAIFPALTALISVYGLVADPADVARLLNSGVLPPGVADLLHGQTHALFASGKTLGAGVIVGFLLAIWSTRRGANAMLDALNIAYGGLAPRGILSRLGLSLVFTLASILFAVVALVAVVVIPALLAQFDFGPIWNAAIAVIRWPILIVLIGCGLALTYRYAPHRRCTSWRLVVCGTAGATVAWLLGSALFSVYVGQFASYNRVYGTVGTVVVLLLWLFISALIVLAGAELNAAIESRIAAARRAGNASPPAGTRET